MNDYRVAMEACAVPEKLAQRLEEKVLAVKPARQRVVRPLSFARKVILAAALTVLLTASVGAVVLVEWSEIFTNRFGQTAEEVPASETLFQKVDVTSVCGDVTLRVPEALGDSQTIYYVLEYQLPEGTDTELVRQVWEGGSDVQMYMPAVEYYGTDMVSWKDYEEEMGHWWSKIEWRPQLEGSPWLTERNMAFYRSLPHPLSEYDFTGGATAGRQSVSFDPDTGTMRFLYFYNWSKGDLTAQPLTVLVYPPSVTVRGEATALADHPALITFQPTQTARAKTGEMKGEGFRLQISVSPFSVNVDYYGEEFGNPSALEKALTLVEQDGEEISLADLSVGNSGSYGGGSVTYRAQFDEILNTERITAVRLGETEVALKESE